MKNRIAVFPGSFDPVTKGHEDIIRRGLSLFDEIIIAVGINSSKKSLFPIENRMKWISSLFKNEPKIKVESYSGLTIDFCKQKNAGFILRGLRNSTDLDFENSIAQMNKAMAKDIETIFLVSSPEYSAISSTIVRNILEHKGDVSLFVPQGIDWTS
jgi:pantetheine-phosphate adenylyltransferase